MLKQNNLNEKVELKKENKKIDLVALGKEIKKYFEPIVKEIEENDKEQILVDGSYGIGKTMNIADVLVEKNKCQQKQPNKKKEYIILNAAMRDSHDSTLNFIIIELKNEISFCYKVQQKITKFVKYIYGTIISITFTFLFSPDIHMEQVAIITIALVIMFGLFLYITGDEVEAQKKTLKKLAKKKIIIIENLDRLEDVEAKNHLSKKNRELLYYLEDLGFKIVVLADIKKIQTDDEIMKFFTRIISIDKEMLKKKIDFFLTNCFNENKKVKFRNEILNENFINNLEPSDNLEIQNSISSTREVFCIVKQMNNYNLLNKVHIPHLFYIINLYLTDKASYDELLEYSSSSGVFGSVNSPKEFKFLYEANHCSYKLVFKNNPDFFYLKNKHFDELDKINFEYLEDVYENNFDLEKAHLFEIYHFEFNQNIVETIFRNVCGTKKFEKAEEVYWKSNIILAIVSKYLETYNILEILFNIKDVDEENQLVILLILINSINEAEKESKEKANKMIKKVDEKIKAMNLKEGEIYQLPITTTYLKKMQNHLKNPEQKITIDKGEISYYIYNLKHVKDGASMVETMFLAHLLYGDRLNKKEYNDRLKINHFNAVRIPSIDKTPLFNELIVSLQVINEQIKEVGKVGTQLRDELKPSLEAISVVNEEVGKIEIPKIHIQLEAVYKMVKNLNGIEFKKYEEQYEAVAKAFDKYK